jgi:hypothetical protein
VELVPGEHLPIESLSFRVRSLSVARTLLAHHQLPGGRHGAPAWRGVRRPAHPSGGGTGSVRHPQLRQSMKRQRSLRHCHPDGGVAQA